MYKPNDLNLLEHNCLSGQLCFPIYSASNSIRRAYKHLLQDLDLTYAQYLVLLVLAEEGTVSLSTICDRLMIAPGALSPVIKRLQGRGILSRRRHPENDRMVEIVLTDQGLAIVKQLPAIQSKLSTLWGLKAQEVQELRRLMKLIRTNLDGFVDASST